MSARDRKGLVYFLQAVEGGPVKIGFTSRTADARLNEVQPAYPYELRPLLIVPGTLQDEIDHHAVFAHLRLRGEWFRPGPDLLGYIKNALRDPEHFDIPLFFLSSRQEEERQGIPRGARLRARHTGERCCQCKRCLEACRLLSNAEAAA